MKSSPYRSNRLLIGTRVDAVYRESEEPMYRHNCYIEALPPSRSWEDVSSLVARYPVYDPQERELPTMRRLDSVCRISSCIFPMPDILILEQKVSRLIRSGYMARNPLDPEWRRQVNAAFKNLPDTLTEGSVTPLIRSTAASIAVIGQSGVGKSTMIESILGLYPQIIVHTEYNGTPFDQHQLVWLKVDCPFDGSLKGLCMEFFNAVDTIMGTRYAIEYKNPRKTIDELLRAMSEIAAELGLGVLVIDEIQRLNEAKSGGAQMMLNFFVQLTSIFSVPVVLVGTYKAFSLFTTDFAMARRAAGQGDVLISNLQKDDYWDYFLGKLWEYQWTNVKTPFSSSFSNVMYNESQGIIDIAVKLYMLTQWSIIGENDERITPARIREVSQECFHAVRPILQALRNNDIATLTKIKDVVPLAEHLQKYLSQAVKRVALSGYVDNIGNQEQPNLSSVAELIESPESQIAAMLVSAGHPVELAQEWARQAVRRFSTAADLKEASSEAFRLATEFLLDKKNIDAPVSKTKTRKSGKAVSLSGDLREIAKQALKKKESVYEVLKAAGTIKPVTEFLDVVGV